MTRSDHESDARPRRWFLAVAGVALMSIGCLPIPWERVVVVRPEVEYRVEEAETGEPIEGITVELCRIRSGPPPSELRQSWTRTTDADGRVTFSYETETETYYPLMMHGKEQRRWTHCLRADDYAGYRRHPDSEKHSATYLISEDMSYEPEEFGKGLEPVRLQVQSEEGEDVRMPSCPCDRFDDVPDGGEKSKE